MGVNRIVAVSAIAGLFFGGWSNTARAVGWDYNLTIDQTQSVVTFDISMDVPIFGDGEDSDSSPVAGYILANLTPPPGGFSSIHITEFDVAFVDTLSFDIDLNFGANFTATISGGALLLDSTHGSPGPAVSVGGGGAFNQTGNLAAAAGLVHYETNVPGFDDGDIDLSLEDPSSLDIMGTVTSTSSLITLEFPISTIFPIIQDGNELGQAVVTGTIVATGIPLIPGDTDGDGDVDIDDLMNLANAYGSLTTIGWGNGNFDSDGDVDINDLSMLASNYGSGVAQAYADFEALSAVPEPVSLGLFALGGLALVRRHR